MKSTYRRTVLQNTSICDQKNVPPSIRIAEGEVGWTEAYNNWLHNKNPTDSPDWKRGVFLHFEQMEIEEESPTQSYSFFSPPINWTDIGDICFMLLCVLLCLCMFAMGAGYYK